MGTAAKIRELQKGSSFIRRMFEEAARMRAEFGAENIYDYSLGNPLPFLPPLFTEILLKEAKKEALHGYMPNGGYPDVKKEIARQASQEQSISLSGDDIVMTTGAGGALNVVLKAILNPGDRVLASRPCFVEYKFYCDNHGGQLDFVDCTLADGEENFSLDIEAFARAIDKRTAAVIVNSPNNPSGKVYSRENLCALADLLRQKSREIGRPIYLISDEPYRKIVFDNVQPPPLMEIYDKTILVTSFSKDLAIAGERIGYIALHPETDEREELLSAFIFCNRILGFVNAPALMQRTVAACRGLSVDVSLYQRKRDLLVAALREMGYEITVPQGTFYLFPKAYDGDDIKTVNFLKEEKILAVPGRGFALPGYFRLSYCLSDEQITASLPGFKAAIEKLKG